MKGRRGAVDLGAQLVGGTDRAIGAMTLDDLQADPTDSGLGPDAVLLASETRSQVRDVLQRLGRKDRKLLMAVFFEQRDKDEVCRELGVSRNYLRVLLHRARQQFMAHYERKSAEPVRNKTMAIRPGRVAHS